MNVPTVCVDCGAEGTIEIDYQRGEAACTECGIVAVMGMLENEQTRYDGDTTMISVDYASSRAAKANDGGGATSRAESGINTHCNSAAALYVKLRERSGCPPSVEESASEFYRSYLKKLAQEHEPLDGTTKTQGACFLLAAAAKHWPIRPHELHYYDTNSFPPRGVTTSVQKVVEKLELKDTLTELGNAEYQDLSRVYLTRLSMNLSKFLGPVSNMASKMNSIVFASQPNATPFAPSIAICVSIYLCSASKKVSRAAWGGDPLPVDKQQLLGQIIAASRHSDDTIKRAVEGCRDYLEKLADASRGTKVTKEVGSKRPAE